MNARLVSLLVWKDVWLMRGPVCAYAAGGLAAVALTAMGGHGRSAGLTLALNVLIGGAFHVMLGPVLGERERGTLAFVLSMPATPRDVAIAKILASYLLFLVPAMFAATTLVWLSPVDVFERIAEAQRPWASIAAGWATYYAFVVGAWLAFFSVVLAAAVVTESIGWTIGTLVALIFVVGNFLLQVAPELVWIGRYLRSLRAGGAALYGTVAAEAVVVVAIVALVLVLQDRKTSFV